jgi:hypothetical protein
MMAGGLSSGIQSIAKGIDEMQQMKAQTQAATALGKTLQKYGAQFGLPQQVIGMAQSSVEQLESPDLTLRAKSVLGKQMTSLFGGVVQMGIEGAIKRQQQEEMSKNMANAFAPEVTTGPSAFQRAVMGGVRFGDLPTDATSGLQTIDSREPSAREVVRRLLAGGMDAGPAAAMFGTLTSAENAQQRTDNRPSQVKAFEYAVNELGMSREEASKWSKAGGGTTINMPPNVGTPPPGYEVIYDGQGRPVKMQAIPGGPAAEEMSRTQKSKEGVTITLRGMANNLNSLYKMGVAVSSTQGTGKNIVNRLRATNLGQVLEEAAGTEAQGLRQAFKNAVPVYINDMRQATEMSARGMDSEKELEFYLRSAGSEKSDIVTSLAALYAAGQRFGAGGLDVLQDLDPELRRAVLVRSGQLLEEGQSEQYRGNSLNQNVSGPRIISVETINK